MSEVIKYHTLIHETVKATAGSTCMCILILVRLVISNCHFVQGWASVMPLFPLQHNVEKQSIPVVQFRNICRASMHTYMQSVAVSATMPVSSCLTCVKHLWLACRATAIFTTAANDPNVLAPTCGGYLEGGYVTGTILRRVPTWQHTTSSTKKCLLPDEATGHWSFSFSHLACIQLASIK